MLLSEVLDLLTVGIVLVDRQGRIVLTNTAGRLLLDAGHALRRQGCHMTANDPRSAECLADAISKIAAGDQLPSMGLAVPIVAPDERDLAVWVLPLAKRREGGRDGLLDGVGEARAAIFVRELGAACDAVPIDLFVERYGLTPAESRVLVKLAKGMTPAETATSLGTTLATTKTHIARLFQKTGARRQADLVRLVMSALAPARFCEL